VIRVLAAFALWANAAQAEPVVQVDPATLIPALAGVQDFDHLPLAPEPGLIHDTLLRVAGLTLGERFVGQSVVGHPHDRLSGAPTAPLALAAPEPGMHLSTAFHPGFGSNALFAVGPDGFAAISGRGEGAVALLFDRNVRAVTLKLHAEYADPLGARALPGRAYLSFFDRAGALIDAHEIALATGVIALGFRLDGDGPGIAGISLTNDDPGGLAVDDIRFPLDPLGS
jgi:hypothetical protein